jgi:arsenate reductase
MYLVYHNPRCKKSRAGLEFLQNNTNEEIKIKKYLNEGLDVKEIKEILSKLNLKVDKILRTQEKFYKENIKNKDLNDDEKIKLITEEPKLLHRPVIIKDKKAVIGDPPENIKDIL